MQIERARKDGEVVSGSRPAGLADTISRMVVAAGSLVALLGCRDIAGYRDLSYSVTVDAACAPVILPSTGAGRIRLVNVGTSGTTTDFCVRPTGTSAWGTPIFASSRASCDTVTSLRISIWRGKVRMSPPTCSAIWILCGNSSIARNRDFAFG